MRFLHTADWHVGKPLRGRSRMDEYAAALEEVGRIAVEAKVDVLLVAGDIFDSPAPPPEAEKLVYDFLARLLPQGIAAVLIAGNHDHPKKLGALASLLEGLRIHVRPEVRPPAQGGVVAVPSRDGSEEARVAVLPFVPERKVVDACTVMDPEHTWFETYAERLEQILAALVAGLEPSTVNLAIGHLLVAGSLFGTGERRLHLGDVYGLNPQQLPSSLQYIGLGHLHRPQVVSAPSPTVYSGSLIELDFGEKEQNKRVVVVDARPGRMASIESVALSSGRRLRDVTGSLEDLRRMARDLGDDFLRVRLQTVVPMPELAEEVKALLPGAVDVSVDHPRDAAEIQREREDPRTRLEPGELFAAYYERKNGAPASEELKRLFRALYEEAQR